MKTINLLNVLRFDGYDEAQEMVVIRNLRVVQIRVRAPEYKFLMFLYRPKNKLKVTKRLATLPCKASGPKFLAPVQYGA